MDLPKQINGIVLAQQLSLPNPIEEQLLRLANSPFTSMDLDKGIFIPDNAYTGFGSTINQ